jgi:hypothetical protein
LYKNADWTQLGDGAEVEADGGGGAVGGGAMSRVGGCDGVQMIAQLGTPRGRYDEHNSKSSLSIKLWIIEPVGERTNLRRLILASFTTAPNNLYMAPHPGRSFAPAAMWNLHTTQHSTLPQLTVRLSISLVCYKQRIKRIEW